MIFPRLLLFAVLIAFPALCFAQLSSADPGPVRSSAAYSEILLRKTELQADIEAFSADYTDTSPKMLDLRFEMAALVRSIDRVFAVKPVDAGKLTLALGKLLVRKAALETDLARLSRSYAAEHPEVKRAKRKVEIFDTAIKEVLK